MRSENRNITSLVWFDLIEFHSRSWMLSKSESTHRIVCYAKWQQRSMRKRIEYKQMKGKQRRTQKKNWNGKKKKNMRAFDCVWYGPGGRARSNIELVTKWCSSKRLNYRVVSTEPNYTSHEIRSIFCATATAPRNASGAAKRKWTQCVGCDEYSLTHVWIRLHRPIVMPCIVTFQSTVRDCPIGVDDAQQLQQHWFSIENCISIRLLPFDEEIVNLHVDRQTIELIFTRALLIATNYGWWLWVIQSVYGTPLHRRLLLNFRVRNLHCKRSTY